MCQERKSRWEQSQELNSGHCRVSPVVRSGLDGRTHRIEVQEEFHVELNKSIWKRPRMPSDREIGKVHCPGGCVHVSTHGRTGGKRGRRPQQDQSEAYLQQLSFRGLAQCGVCTERIGECLKQLLFFHVGRAINNDEQYYFDFRR